MARWLGGLVVAPIACAPAAVAPTVPVERPAVATPVEQPRPVIPGASASSPAHLPMPASSRACDKARAAQQERLRMLLRSSRLEEKTLAPGLAADSAALLRGLCLPDDKGAWAQVFGDVSLLGDGAVGWVSAQGKRAVARLDLEGNEIARSSFYSFRESLPSWWARDLDGDGFPEVMLEEYIDRPDDPTGPHPAGRLLRYHAQTIEPYPGAEKIEFQPPDALQGEPPESGDDGSHLLAYMGPFRVPRLPDMGGNSYFVCGAEIPPMIARVTRSGSLSLSDKIAREQSLGHFNRESCEPSPESSRADSYYGADLARSVRCFSLKGQADKARAVAALCKPKLETCGYCELMRRWASLPPPLALEQRAIVGRKNN